MRRTTTVTVVVGALLLLAGSARGQSWERGREARLEARLERLGERIERIGWRVERTVERIVSRTVERALERGLEVGWDRDRGPVRSQETFSWEGRVARGGTVEIKGVNGPVLAEPAEGDRVRVVAEKRGRRDDPEEVEVRVLEHGGGVTVCAVYPRGRDGRANRCSPGEGGHVSSRDNDVQVTFRVRVPEGVHFAGRTVNGDVEIRDLTGDALGYTVNGSVELSTAGAARAKTVNGSIDAAFGRLTRGAEFETVNGSIELDVPDDLDAEIDARWLNGGIESELPLTLRGRFSKRRARGTLGAGGPLIALSTVNGSITIR